MGLFEGVDASELRYELQGAMRWKASDFKRYADLRRREMGQVLHSLEGGTPSS